MNTIIGFIAKPLGMGLSALYELVGSYGIALIIITIIVKCCLYPLYVKQMKSTAGMGRIQGKIRDYKARYGHDKELLNEKVNQLYKDENVSPLSGCLPMIIQMIIIFGLFALLRNPLNYIANDDMLFAIHESFLWIPDLSQPDKWILPIAAGVATFIAFSLNSMTMTTGAAGASASGMQKVMKYVFPIMIVLMGRAFPAGLAIYWSFGQVMQIFFNLRMNKIREKIMSGEGGKK